MADLSPGDPLATPRHLPAPLRPAAVAPNEVVVLAHLLGGGRNPTCQAPSYVTADPVHAQVMMRAVEGYGVRVDVTRQGARWRLTFVSGRSRSGRRRCSDVVDWLVHLGIHGRGRSDVAVPPSVFSLPSDQLATFLRHLWSTTGGAWPDGRRQRVRCRFTTSSRALAEDVQSLMLRFGVVSRVVEAAGARCPPTYHVSVSDLDAQRRFLAEIGVFGAGEEGASASAALVGRAPGAPRRIGGPAAADARVAHLDAQPTGSGARTGTTLVADPRTDDEVGGSPEVWWDPVVAIVACGEAPVFDATVPGTHNFLANGIVAHNSIEQDADVVLFLYRDEIYNQESSDRGKAEVIVAKHRNGPTGLTQLAFVDRFARFNNMARE